MRNTVFIILMYLGLGIHAQYTQCDSLYLPTNTINELVLGTVVEGDSVLVAVMMNNQTDFGIRFRRIGHDGGIGTEYFFALPYFSVGPIYSQGLEVSTDGGYFLGLYTAGELQYFTGVVLKFTHDFQFEWQRNADHFQSEYNSGSWNVIHLTNDNQLLAVGTFAWHANPGQDDGTHYGVALTKYTSAGDTLWTKVIDFGVPLNSITKIYELPNGELLLTGVWDNVMTSKSVIYKIGADGEYWDKIVQGPAGLYGTTPVGFYHNGKFYAFFGAHQDEFGAIPVEMKYYMATLDIESMTWDDQIELSTDFEVGEDLGAGFTDVVNLNNGHAILAAIKFVDTIQQQDPVYLINVDTTGAVNWLRYISVPSVPGSYLHNLPSFLDQASDGGYTINGYFSNTIIQQAHWYVKTDPCGQVLQYPCDPNGVEEMATAHGVAVYPNPASNQLFVIAEEEMRGIALYNMYGQLIEQHAYQQRRLLSEFDVSKLAAGVYLVQVVMENGTSINLKIIVE